MKIKVTAVVVELSFEKDFLTFLEQNNVLERYCTRLCTKQKSDFLTFLVSEIQPTKWISGAFPWDDSKFWKNLSNKWEETISQDCKTLFEVIDKDKSQEIWDKLLMYSGSLRGKYYKVGDNSWNRPSDQAIDSQKVWSWDNYGWKDLAGKTYLILSEKPVIKEIESWFSLVGLVSYPFIKIWVPEQECVQWVLYQGYSYVRESEKD